MINLWRYRKAAIKKFDPSPDDGDIIPGFEFIRDYTFLDEGNYYDKITAR